MRNILFVGLACAALAGQVAAAEKVVLEADDDYAPYSYVEKGQHKGIYVDFLKKVAEKPLLFVFIGGGQGQWSAVFRDLQDTAARRRMQA